MKRTGRCARLAEAVLWLAGIVIVSVEMTGTLEARAARLQANVIVQTPAALEAPASAAAKGSVIGRLEIGGIHLTVPVLADDDPATLVRGVGHMPGTAVPGGLGNMVLAGHRDTFFRPLRRIRAGMEMMLVTPGGRFRYVVDGTEVVKPDALDVLDIGERPEMTLITCYPFDFIGAAPQRFVVHAHLVSDPG